ncbi:MAG: S-layer homology domain-containing protein [Clostridia bacterium]|nr:S-layer homology domain-containing protein [Clostridia bacterium]
MFRRFCSFLSVIAVSFAVAAANVCASDEDILTIEQSAVRIRNNETVDIAIGFNLSEPIRGVQFTVSYDYGKFEVSKVTKGDAADDAVVSRIDTETFGKVNVAIIYDSEYRYNGQICTITLISREKTGLGESLVNVRGITFTDKDNKNVKCGDMSTKVELYSDNHPATETPVTEAPINETLHSTEQPTRPSAGKSSGGGGGSFGVSGNNVTETTSPMATATAEPEEITPTKQSCGFTDIAGHWAEADIEYLYDAGIINGVSDTEFMPEQNVTRAEFVKMIFEIADFGEITENPFDDITENAWYYEPVLKAYSAGIVNGYDVKFLPEQNITREEMAVIADRCIKLLGYERPVVNELVFADAETFSNWSRDAIARMAGMGLLNGKDADFAPKEYTTRAQAAAVIKRIYDFHN